jgi:hypothetical protein
MRAFFKHIGRSQIDHDPLGRKRQTQGRQGRTDPLATLPHRLVGKSNHNKVNLATGQLHLNLDIENLDTL